MSREPPELFPLALCSSNTPAFPQKSWRDLPGKILAVCSLSFWIQLFPQRAWKSLPTAWARPREQPFFSLVHSAHWGLLGPPQKEMQNWDKFLVFVSCGSCYQKIGESDRAEKALPFWQGNGTLRKARIGSAIVKCIKMSRRGWNSSQTVHAAEEGSRDFFTSSPCTPGILPFSVFSTSCCPKPGKSQHPYSFPTCYRQGL